MPVFVDDVPAPPLGAPLGAWEDDGLGHAPPAALTMALRLDPTTGELGSVLRGYHPIDHAFAYAFTVRHDAGVALGASGNRFHLIRKADQGAARALADEARRIAQPFIGRGWIALRRVAVEVAGDSGVLVVDYTNQVTAKDETLRIPTRTL